eukprot:5730392-Alexandrium_andersonii.AAC.1
MTMRVAAAQQQRALPLRAALVHVACTVPDDEERGSVGIRRRHLRPVVVPREGRTEPAHLTCESSST